MLFRSPPLKVLIVRLGAFGDIIHTLPLAAELCAAGAQVDWLCDNLWGCVLTDNPAIHRCWTVPRRAWKKAGLRHLTTSFAEAKQIVGQLREQQYDVVIDAQGRAKSALFSFFCGARARLSHQRGTATEGAWLCSQRRMRDNQTHIIDKMRSLIIPLHTLYVDGRENHPWSFPLPAWTTERQWAQDYLRQEELENVWIWNVGATWRTKIWPMQRQQEFLRQVIAAGHQIMIVWGPGWEKEHAAKLAASVDGAYLAPATTIPQLAALMAAAHIVISCDTGPLHLAMAMGTATVGLFGPVPAERNGPRGYGHRCIQAPAQQWERKDISTSHMEKISASQVLREALYAIQQTAI